MLAFDPVACFAAAQPPKRARSPSPPPLPPLVAQPVAPTPRPTPPTPPTPDVGATPPTRALLPHETFLQHGAAPAVVPPPARAPMPHELFMRTSADARQLMPPPPAPSGPPLLRVDLPLPEEHGADAPPPHAEALDRDPRRAGCERLRTPWCPMAGLMREDGGIHGWLDAQRAHLGVQEN